MAIAGRPRLNWPMLLGVLGLMAFVGAVLLIARRPMIHLAFYAGWVLFLWAAGLWLDRVVRSPARRRWAYVIWLFLFIWAGPLFNRVSRGDHISGWTFLDTVVFPSGFVAGILVRGPKGDQLSELRLFRAPGAKQEAP